jgi:predicted PurR-regulated permease PerM
MIVIVVASEAAGLWGIVLAVPLVAAARDVFRYFYREWSNADEVQPAALSSDSDPADAAPPGETAS